MTTYQERLAFRSMLQRVSSSLASQQTGDTYDTMDFGTDLLHCYGAIRVHFDGLPSGTTSQFATNMLGNLESGADYLCNPNGNSTQAFLAQVDHLVSGFETAGNFYSTAGNQQLSDYCSDCAQQYTDFAHNFPSTSETSVQMQYISGFMGSMRTFFAAAVKYAEHALPLINGEPDPLFKIARYTPASMSYFNAALSGVIAFAGTEGVTSSKLKSSFIAFSTGLLTAVACIEFAPSGVVGVLTFAAISAVSTFCGKQIVVKFNRTVV